ncbi:MAG: hypothetical protein JOZ55_04475 [Alphaproteobacteria bacterium]|nr:hypothetical protein [Alphaproteobacteria bacterium]
MPTPRTAHRLSLAFGLMVLALSLVGLILPTQPVCGNLAANYPTIIAFELVRSLADLEAIFGSGPGGCRTAVAAQMDFINTVDSIAFIPAYGAFLIFFFLGLRRNGLRIARTAIVIIVLACFADYVENFALFHLSAAPEHLSWLSLLIPATETKWVGLAVAAMLSVPLLWGGWRGGFALVLCGIGLVAALLTIPAPAVVGPYLSNGIALGWLLFLAIDLGESFRHGMETT